MKTPREKHAHDIKLERVVCKAVAWRFQGDFVDASGRVPAGFLRGSCGVPEGFLGGLCGFRPIFTPIFTGVPVRETPPFIILITGKVCEKQRAQLPQGGSRILAASSEGLEFYRTLFEHMQNEL